MNKPKSAFPSDFLWGASVASHQVEGNTHNQWTVWELANASELAKTAHKRLGWLPNWDEIKAEAEKPDNYVSGRGIDHYHRYEEDFNLAKQLNLNSFRFGIEWSRLEPEEGHWDEAAFEHYHKYIAALRARHIEPVLNIWHWTMPTWFTDMGGFEKRSNLVHFERFIERVAQEYGHKVRYIITLNEPNVYASFSYLTGEWPPQHKRPLLFFRVYLNLVHAHRRAFKILKKANPQLQIGVASQLANIQARRPHNLIDQFATQAMRYGWNWWFLNRIRRYQDFVGFNFYFGDYYQGFKRINPKTPVSDLGWYMEPEALYSLLSRVWAHYKKPLLITENGLADAKDEHRDWWLQETMIAMEKACSENIQVIGYLHWSLLDNFEWAYGWWPKFGLVSVDRRDMKRTIRPSAKRWAKQLAELREL